MKTKDFVKCLRLFPQSELRAIMDDAGFTPIQVSASMTYIYDRPDINWQADMVGESVSTFYRRRSILIKRLQYYINVHHIPLPSDNDMTQD